MLTNFTAAQLRDPQIAEANAILQTCVHYGFCTNTCPTYVLTRDENESPRGRIDLIRAMLEKGGPVLAPQVFLAEGAVRKRVALLAGCAQRSR
jgi:Fe-S oxidoreductase